MEKLIYDMEECRAGHNCPKFVINKKTKIVSLIDKKGNRSEMNIKHFNKFIKAVKNNEIKEIKL